MCVTNGNKCTPSPDFVEHRTYVSIHVELEIIDSYANFLTGIFQLVLREVSNIYSCVTSGQSRYKIFKCLLRKNSHLLSTFQG